MHRKRGTNLDGSPARPSKKASRKRCGGISKVGHGGKRRGSTSMAEHASGFLKCSTEIEKWRKDRSLLQAKAVNWLGVCLTQPSCTTCRSWRSAGPNWILKAERGSTA